MVGASIGTRALTLIRSTPFMSSSSYSTPSRGSWVVVDSVGEARDVVALTVQALEHTLDPAGLAISSARPWKKTVSRIDSASASRSSWAISSSPVASGTGRVPGLVHTDRGASWPRPGRMLLVADRVVAVAPPSTACPCTLSRSFRIPSCQRLRPGRAAGTWTSIGMNLSDGNKCVVVEHAHRRAARAHRDRPFRLEHLVVDPPDDRRHLDRHPSRQQDQVRLARRGTERLPSEARDIHPRPDDRHHLDRAAGEPECQREERVAAGPRRPPCRRSSSSPAARRSLELLIVSIAAQHVARLQLPDAEVR